MQPRTLHAAGVVLGILLLPATGSGQGGVTRDDAGVTARAVRIDRPIALDGRLSEEVYQSIPPIDGFIQQEPAEGAPASERTEAWIFFDDSNLYVAARCWDSQPGREVLTEMRRDQNNITQNESFTVVFDTFLDRRSGFFFQTSPLGALRDQAIVDDVLNVSWNTVWDVRTGRFEGGWTVEMVIPFKSLRYPGSGPQVWGLNMRRVVKGKNEYSYLTAMPASYGTGMAIARMGSAGTLVGVETPRQSLNLELKPFAVSSVTTDNTTAQPFANDLKSDAGFDFKYGVTRSLIADVTVNTDFAQVEEDVQQVNLTRFSLFFPEKRDFFLEGQGIFAFGGIGSGNQTPGDVPVLFFSRRIGLNQGQAVPVIGGARLTGRAGQYSIGALNIETGAKASARAFATNFQFAFEPTLSLNWVDLPFGRFAATLVSTRFVVTPTPRMGVSSLLQVNTSTHTVSSSIRLRWEYRPGSDLFVVYSDGRNTLEGAAPGLLNRSVAVKATRLVRF